MDKGTEGPYVLVPVALICCLTLCWVDNRRDGGIGAERLLTPSKWPPASGVGVELSSFPIGKHPVTERSHTTRAAPFPTRHISRDGESRFGPGNYPAGMDVLSAGLAAHSLDADTRENTGEGECERTRYDTTPSPQRWTWTRPSMPTSPTMLRNLAGSPSGIGQRIHRDTSGVGTNDVEPRAPYRPSKLGGRGIGGPRHISQGWSSVVSEVVVRYTA